MNVYLRYKKIQRKIKRDTDSFIETVADTIAAAILLYLKNEFGYLRTPKVKKRIQK